MRLNVKSELEDKLDSAVFTTYVNVPLCLHIYVYIFHPVTLTFIHNSNCDGRVRRNFSILPTDASACGLEELGTDPRASNWETTQPSQIQSLNSHF